MVRLPADVLYLVCEEVSKMADFNTLFNCSLSSKELVQPALQWLYKYTHMPHKFRVAC